MRSGRTISSVCVLICTLVSQCWLAAQTFGDEQHASKSSAESKSQQQPTPSPMPAEPNGPAPKIYFENTTHDFGPVSPGSTNPCEFKFQNKGEGLLIIGEITKTCGCTVPTLDKKEYAPGETGTITVQFSADRSPGVRTRHLYVFSNDKETPKVELTIKASIAQKVVFDPDQLNYKLKGENAGVAELTISSVDGQMFAITQFMATNDAVTVDFNPGQKAAKFVLETKIDPEKMGPNSSGRIEITLTHPDNPSIIVPFSVLARFRTDPPAINVVNAEMGKTVQKELWVLSNYDEDFEISSVTSKDGTIKVLSREKLGNRYKFNIEITPPKKDVLRMFTDTLTLNTKDGETISIACRGFFRLK